MALYRRKAITAVRDGDYYKLTDGLGNISIMSKKQFEALFEQVDDDVVAFDDGELKSKKNRK